MFFVYRGLPRRFTYNSYIPANAKCHRFYFVYPAGMGCIGEVVWDFCFVLFFLFFMINIQFIGDAGNLSQLHTAKMGVYLSGFRTVMTQQAHNSFSQF